MPGFTSKSGGAVERRREKTLEQRPQASDHGEEVVYTRDEWVAKYTRALREGHVWDIGFGPFDAEQCRAIRAEVLPKDVLERGGDLEAR